jgi:hypothetical protein
MDTRKKIEHRELLDGQTIKRPKEGEPLPWREWAIHWSPQERRVVLIEMFRLSERYPKETAEWLCRSAQNVLPPHRRRSDRSMKLGRKTIKLYNALCEIFDEETGEFLDEQ